MKAYESAERARRPGGCYCLALFWSSFCDDFCKFSEICILHHKSVRREHHTPNVLAAHVAQARHRKSDESVLKSTNIQP